MKAVVLAAGRGSRLGTLTEDRPKPMLPVRGRPVIAHVLERLAAAGVGEVFVNLHHRPDALREYCGDGGRWGLRISYAFEPELLGTAGAVANFAPHLGDAPFFVVYGDNYLECDFGTLRDGHADARALATLALFEKEDASGSGIVEMGAGGRISRFVEKPSPDTALHRLVNGGLYVCSPAILPLLPETRPCDFGYDVFPRLLAAGHALYGRVMSGHVWGIDTPSLYRGLCARMAHDPA